MIVLAAFGTSITCNKKMSTAKVADEAVMGAMIHSLFTTGTNRAATSSYCATAHHPIYMAPSGHNEACTKVQRTGLKSEWRESASQGLFATRTIKKDELVARFVNGHTMINDGAIDLTRATAAKTPRQLERALMEMWRDYDDPAYINSHVNSEARENNTIHATRTIRPGEEVLRRYGTFGYWLLLLEPLIKPELLPTLAHVAAKWLQLNGNDWKAPNVRQMIRQIEARSPLHAGSSRRPRTTTRRVTNRRRRPRRPVYK